MSRPNRRCLVLGSQGFIGQHVMRAEELFSRELAARVTGQPSNFDVRNGEAIHKLLDDCKPDFIVHLAAMTFVPDSIADPATT